MKEDGLFLTHLCHCHISALSTYGGLLIGSEHNQQAIIGGLNAASPHGLLFPVAFEILGAGSDINGMEGG